MKTVIILRRIFFLFIITSSAGTVVAEDPVHFNDANLKAMVEDALWIVDPTPTDMLELLDLTNPGWFRETNAVEDLTGLEYATNLQVLNLRFHNIKSLASISSLANLHTLILSRNDSILSIKPIENLHSLRVLDLHGTGLAGITSLGMLSQLEELTLRFNFIEDISALSTLPNLHYLNLQSNYVADLSPLSELEDLNTLILYENQTSDLEALKPLLRLRSLDVRNNPLGPEAYCKTLYTLTENNPGMTLEYNARVRPIDIAATDGLFSNRVHLSWEHCCNGPAYTSYYQVGRAKTPTDPLVPISPWLSENTFNDHSAEPGTTYYYRVRMSVSPQGVNSGSWGRSGIGRVGPNHVLAITSSPGGSVVLPGEGEFPVTNRNTLTIRAESDDSDLFVFDRWTGTSVNLGYVEDSKDPVAHLTVQESVTLKANFLSTLEIVTVDNSRDNLVKENSNSIEDGTELHPFDHIQEAVDVAAPGTTVFVKMGHYFEALYLENKEICLTGIHTQAEAFPILDGNDLKPLISLADEGGTACTVKGFILTRGRGVIDCNNTQLFIANCLIAGNRANHMSEGIVVCANGQVTLENCTIADNLGTGLHLRNSHFSMSSSILWMNVPQDFNIEGVVQPQIEYSLLSSPWPGEGNVSGNPLFITQGRWQDTTGDASPEWIPGDYHLSSQFGHWDSKLKTWQEDILSSPGLDAAEPAMPWLHEPAPNGSRANLGAYGNTVESSLSDH